MTRVIVDTCIKCAACVGVCPTGAIEEGEDQFYINPDTCIDCAACEEVCPTGSIFPDTDLPEEYKDFIEKNKAFFA